MGASGELIRMMNYIDDIAATLRRVSGSLHLLNEEEKRASLNTCASPIPISFPSSGNWSPRLSWMPEIHTIAVIGAGIMGRGIAHAAALGGYRTILEDILPTTLRKAETEIRANLDKAVELGKVTPGEAAQASQRLEYASSVEQAAREADLVIEAVPEEMESKLEIFTLLDKVCRPTTIIASNTSSLSITEISSVTYRAPKCVGMHFFNPVHKMKLLEIVRALETDDETLAAAVEVGRRMGKEVVVILKSPGFITSRINALIGNEAFHMLQEGVASAEDIDKAVKLGLNHPWAHLKWLTSWAWIPAFTFSNTSQDPRRKISPRAPSGPVRQSRPPRPQVRPRRVRLPRAARRAWRGREVTATKRRR